jgi:predicted HicB family RNase H-like nuclease
MRYPITIVWSEEDKVFIARMPQLEGLSAFGDTQEEAIQELKIAYELYSDSCHSRGIALPEPEKEENYSGQTRLRMPKSMHAQLANSARKEGVSLNTYIVALLSEQESIKSVTREIYEMRSVMAKIAQPFSGEKSDQYFPLGSGNAFILPSSSELYRRN